MTACNYTFTTLKCNLDIPIQPFRAQGPNMWVDFIARSDN